MIWLVFNPQKLSLSYGQDLLAADILVCIRSPAAQKVGCKKIMLCHESEVCYDRLRIDEECWYIGTCQSVSPLKVQVLLRSL